ncbi:Uncharacterized protein BM_BM13417 [Brugia malayi]|uniref:Bm13417 n=1 Tax=Brugia malayi TaxID=6279 RepID=A0A0K0IXS1_BRUMA|nr:Uncharacterized protein BM_BM13417 [Brugia malayi]CDP94064.1 Bm13417 [Brugia malayi]VIO88644.1 Uncharacterized protein BM_BM13417 [Brugia malayi]
MIKSAKSGKRTVRTSTSEKENLRNLQKFDRTSNPTLRKVQNEARKNEIGNIPTERSTTDWQWECVGRCKKRWTIRSINQQVSQFKIKYSADYYRM